MGQLKASQALGRMQETPLQVRIHPWFQNGSEVLHPLAQYSTCHGCRWGSQVCWREKKWCSTGPSHLPSPPFCSNFRSNSSWSIPEAGALIRLRGGSGDILCWPRSRQTHSLLQLWNSCSWLTSQNWTTVPLATNATCATRNSKEHRRTLKLCAILPPP